MELPYFSIHDFQRYQQALAFAACKHANQRRKNRQASPYINHPLSLVTVLLQEANVWVNSSSLKIYSNLFILC